jgi:hypothetical protein
MAIGTRMQQRRATAAVWNTSDYILAPGELGVTTDTNIIKIGDGVNTWSNLDNVFDTEYLPILGTAANSELLGGVSVTSLVKVADTDVNPTNNTYVKRTADGGVKVTDATEATEATSLQQQSAAIVEAQKMLFSRTITANGTLALTDISKMIAVNHASLTAQITVTLPRNSDVAIPVGSYIDIVAVGNGGVKIVPYDGSVGINGKVNVMPNFGVIRLVKNDTNQWIGIEISKKGRLPKITVVYTTGGQSLTSTACVAYDSTISADTYNPDSDFFSIPGTGLSTARRIIVNKDGEYLLNVVFSNNGVGNTMYCSIRKMLTDNSATGATIIGVQSYVNVTTVTVQKKLTAGDSVGVWSTGATSASIPADATASGGNPNTFCITRIGD